VLLKYRPSASSILSEFRNCVLTKSQKFVERSFIRSSRCRRLIAGLLLMTRVPACANTPIQPNVRVRLLRYKMSIAELNGWMCR
jgi:hypothetical protein